MNEEWRLAQELTKKALQDFDFFCRRCFHIKTKAGDVKTLEMTHVQRLLAATWERQIAEGKPIRIIILKARQMGISTLIDAYILWRELRQGNVNALEIAHEKDAAAHILDINKFAVENFPPWFVAVLQIDTGLFNKTEVKFDHNNALLNISSADSKEPGRSRTIHYLHLSEVAFYPPGSTIVRSAFSGVPDHPGSIIFLESTGNGPAGFFYNHYTAAKNGKNDYIPVFFPWFYHEEYRMKVPDGVEVECPPRIHQFYMDGLIDDEQLYWRQHIIANKFEGNEANFLAENPEFEEDAWFTEAANLFDTSALYERLKHLPAYDAGFLVDGVFQPQPQERLHIYKYPEKGRVYVIGADVGSGVTVNRVGDGSSADVLDAETGEQVAHLYVVAEPTLYAADLLQLGRFYHDAMIAPEVTGGHGLSVVNWLRDNGYTNLYLRRVFDKISQQHVHRLGWDTTKSTRPFMINHLRAAWRNGEVVVNEESTIREMLTFVKNGDKFEAAPGAKDDRVMSLAIANMVRKDAAQFVQSTVAQAQEEAKDEEIPVRRQFVLNHMRNKDNDDLE